MLCRSTTWDHMEVKNRCTRNNSTNPERTLLDNSVVVHMNFAGRGGKHGIENMKHLRFVVSENCSLVGVLFC